MTIQTSKAVGIFPAFALFLLGGSPVAKAELNAEQPLVVPVGIASSESMKEKQIGWKAPK